MMVRVAFGFLMMAAAAATPAAASEAVIRGGSISFPQAAQEPAYSGSSMAPRYSGSSLPAAPPATILRGSVPSNNPTPASDLGADVDGPIYNPHCLYTEPPTCR